IITGKIWNQGQQFVPKPPPGSKKIQAKRRFQIDGIHSTGSTHANGISNSARGTKRKSILSNLSSASFKGIPLSARGGDIGTHLQKVTHRPSKSNSRTSTASRDESISSTRASNDAKAYVQSSVSSYTPSTPTLSRETESQIQ